VELQWGVKSLNTWSVRGTVNTLLQSHQYVGCAPRHAEGHGPCIQTFDTPLTVGTICGDKRVQRAG
jgi:hypothetical protein